MSSPQVDLVVDWCSYEAAKYAVEKWHYSGRMPAGRNNYIGVWENNRFIGSIVYGFSISPQLGVTFGLMQHQITELRRIALCNHISPISQVISHSIKLLGEKNTGIRLIVSFADSEQGHTGKIYQASNWIYIGYCTKRQMEINGRWRNDIHSYRMGIPPRRTSPPKYKYLYPLDRAMRRQIAPLAQPYPKREDAGEVSMVTRPATSGEGQVQTLPPA